MSLGFINRLEAFILFIGDVAILYVSLWVTLLFRHFTPPSLELWSRHATPFSILFVVWVLVFFIAGLYEKHTTILKSRLPSVIFNAQLVNGAVAVLFFFLIPYFGITPKTILFIYLVVSFGLFVFWRVIVFPFFGTRRQQPAILVGSGEEMQELMQEVNGNPRYGLYFVSSVDLDEVEGLDFKSEILERVYAEDIETVVVDTNNEQVLPILPQLYNLMFSRVRFIDMHRVYEDIFDRVPLSLVEYSWFLENISATRKFTYEFLKRIMDIVIAVPLAVLSLIVYPFIIAAIKFQDGGRVFYVSERIGENNKRIRIIKFRTMTGTDTDTDVLKSRHTETSIGKVLRKTRLDELPQLWDVIQGDLSLIGPRPEFPALVKHYSQEVPFYNIRHLIKPGLSGWGQINDPDVPRKEADVKKTRRKLSYDLYYIKNRSFLLDLKIALKTIKALLSRTGR